MVNVAQKRYYTFDRFLKERFGFKVRKICVDAGFTCPNRDGKTGYGGCIYCHAPGFVPYDSERGKSVAVQREEGKSRLRARGFKGKFLVYFQAYSNTYAPVSVLKDLYDEALADEDVIGLAIGTRPDCVPEEVLVLLEDYAKKYHVWIEYGIQSVHDRTLEYINRGHDYAQFEDAVERTRNRGIFICAHIILGLPGEKKDHMCETAKRLSDLGIDGVKVHHLQVVQGTDLEAKYNKDEVRVFQVEEYIPLLCDIIEVLSPGIVVHRLVGDIRNELLIAPRWTRSKAEILNLVDKELIRRGSCQGTHYRNST